MSFSHSRIPVGLVTISGASIAAVLTGVLTGPPRPCSHSSISSSVTTLVEAANAPSSCTAARPVRTRVDQARRSEEHTSELQSRFDLVCRRLLAKKKYYKHIL